MSGRQADDAIRVVAEGPGNHHHSVRPGDFNLKSADTLASTFGKAEVERAAKNLIHFCQRRGGWYPFTIEELIAFYKEMGENPRLIFFGLVGAWEDNGMLAQLSGNPWHEPRVPYLALGANGMYYVTERFIQQCIREKPIVSAGT